MKLHVWAAGFAGALFLFASPAFAQLAPPSDCFTIFDPAGQVFKRACANEVGEEDVGVLNIYIIPDAGLLDPNQFNHPTLILDPDQTISDVFGIAQNQPGCLDTSTQNPFCLGFASDTETLSPDFGLTDVLTLPEGNGIFPATQYLSLELQRLGYTAQFQSDSEVPEPATLALLGLGALGLGFARRRTQ